MLRVCFFFLRFTHMMSHPTTKKIKTHTHTKHSHSHFIIIIIIIIYFYEGNAAEALNIALHDRTAIRLQIQHVEHFLLYIYIPVYIYLFYFLLLLALPAQHNTRAMKKKLKASLHYFFPLKSKRFYVLFFFFFVMQSLGGCVKKRKKGTNLPLI